MTDTVIDATRRMSRTKLGTGTSITKTMLMAATGSSSVRLEPDSIEVDRGFMNGLRRWRNGTGQWSWFGASLPRPCDHGRPSPPAGDRATPECRPRRHRGHRNGVALFDQLVKRAGQWRVLNDGDAR